MFKTELKNIYSLKLLLYSLLYFVKINQAHMNYNVMVCMQRKYLSKLAINSTPITVQFRKVARKSSRIKHPLVILNLGSGLYK